VIKRLYIHNFRCLENFELPIAGKPSSLLIGKNGSGKSTVGVALELLQSIARGTNRIGQLVKPADFSRDRSDIPMRFEIEAELEGRLYKYELALECPERFTELRISVEIFSVDGIEYYSRKGSDVIFTNINKPSGFQLSWHLVALPVIQEKSDRDPLSVFKSWLSRLLILSPIPSMINGDSEGETLSPNRSVTNFGEWFSGLIALAPAAYTQIEKYIKNVLPDFVDVKNPNRGNDFRTLVAQFHQDRVSLNIPFRSLSDGEKCYFICALVIASNEAYGPLLCFWDEPDNYLAPSEVGHLVMALRRAFQNKGQLIVTSHNTETIRQFSDENTLYLYRNSHLEPTQVRPLSDIEVHGELGDALIRGDVEP
jgi:energy-coupling factor transporter ATP-binding protein EcfA2